MFKSTEQAQKNVRKNIWWYVTQGHSETQHKKPGKITLQVFL